MSNTKKKFRLSSQHRISIMAWTGIVGNIVHAILAMVYPLRGYYLGNIHLSPSYAIAPILLFCAFYIYLGDQFNIRSRKWRKDYTEYPESYLTLAVMPQTVFFVTILACYLLCAVGILPHQLSWISPIHPMFMMVANLIGAIFLQYAIWAAEGEAKESAFFEAIQKKAEGLRALKK